MRLIRTVSEMQATAKSLRNDGTVIGFVPTMGALHEGHLSLIRAAKQNSDKTVISIFVNPTQFSPSEDLNNYPEDLKSDEKLAGENGVDIIFCPSVEEMYPDGFGSLITVESVSEILEGKSRPTHFRGVTTIVNKLFNIVKPHQVFFGQKDAQQTVVIKKMVRDLNIDIEIRVCPMVREEDGLALSSRNAYLSPEAREQATLIYQALTDARNAHENGTTSVEELEQIITNKIRSSPLAIIDYVSIVDSDSLQSVASTIDDALVVVAVQFENTRLIDNITL